jgi:signal transduction histidine kinase
VVADELPRLLVDRDRIIQLLSNYLSNAVKFTPAGGCITVTAERAADQGVRFAVSDSGPGITAADLPFVFNRFWQAKRTAHLGSGLGLAIVKGIATAHRGEVSVDTEPGRGTTFSLLLPISAECA